MGPEGRPPTIGTLRSWDSGPGKVPSSSDGIRRHLDYVVSKDAEHPIKFGGIPIRLILLENLANLGNGFLWGEDNIRSCLF